MYKHRLSWTWKELRSLIGSCGELNSEFLRNVGRFSLVFLFWVVSSKFRGWVVSDFVGWSFRPIFRVSQFGLSSLWPKSEKVIMYALLYDYGLTDGQVLSFVKKNRPKWKRALSGLGLNGPMSKCPRRGQSDPLLLHCDSGKSRKFVEKTTHQHIFRDTSAHFLRQFTKNILLDFELKIIKVSVN